MTIMLEISPLLPNCCQIVTIFKHTFIICSSYIPQYISFCPSLDSLETFTTFAYFLTFFTMLKFLVTFHTFLQLSTILRQKFNFTFHYLCLLVITIGLYSPMCILLCPTFPHIWSPFANFKHYHVWYVLPHFAAFLHILTLFVHFSPIRGNENIITTCGASIAI